MRFPAIYCNSKLAQEPQAIPGKLETVPDQVIVLHVWNNIIAIIRIYANMQIYKYNKYI